MSRFSLLLVAFICALLLEGDIALSQEVARPMQLKTWQERLEYAMSKNSASRDSVRCNSICCIGYTHKGRIETEVEKHKTIERLFSDSSSIVQYIGTQNYEIVSVKTMMQESKASGITEDIFTKIKSQLKDSVRIGMELIEIEWLYKGNTFYSTAIVSNEYGGFIYDNIGYFILDRTESH